MVPNVRGQLEATESLNSKAQIQDGGCKSSTGPDQEERLDGLYRPEGRLSLCTSLRESPEVPLIYVAGVDVRIIMPPLWPEQCPKSIYLRN